jgi:hypothetical protein
VTWIGILLASLLLPHQSRADERPLIPPLHLPLGFRTQIGVPPAEMQCYDLGGYKELLKLDATLTSALRMNDLLSEKAEQLESLVGNLQQEMKLRQDSVFTLQAENTRLFDTWKQENQRRLELENRPSSDLPWLPWGIAGVATITVVVLSVVLVSK